MYHILHSCKQCKVNTFCKKLVEGSAPQAPENQSLRSVVVGYSWRYTPFQLSLTYKEGPCAWWLVCDTNFSGAGEDELSFERSR